MDKNTKKICKICGLTQPEDVELCNSLEVDFTGFIFVQKSQRYIAPKAVAQMPRSKTLRVGVFANSDKKEIMEYSRIAELDFIQLHGNESIELCRDIGPERIIKVLWPELQSSIELEEEMERFAPVCSFFLFDAGSKGGGSGNVLHWEDFSNISSLRPWLLAGGLGASNVVEAITICSPSGVDLNSALENSPGIKNHDLVKKAVSAIRSL